MPAFSVTTADGTEIRAQHFVAGERGVRGALIVLCGVGASQQRYRAFALHMASVGWHVITFDYRGVGLSRGAVAGPLTMSAWGEHDFDAIIGWTQAHLAPRHLVAVGHSIGGQLLSFAPRASAIDASICVAAQRGHWCHWTGGRRLLLLVLWYLYIPLFSALFGWVPLPGGRQYLPSAAARDWARWGRDDDYRRACGTALRPRFATFRAPMLFLSFDDDRLFAPRRAVDALARRYYVAAARTRLHIEPPMLGLSRIGHSGLFDSSHQNVQFWSSLSDWLYNQSHRPSSDPAATWIERDVLTFQRELRDGCSPGRCACRSERRAPSNCFEASNSQHATSS